MVSNNVWHTVAWKHCKIMTKWTDVCENIPQTITSVQLTHSMHIRQDRSMGLGYFCQFVPLPSACHNRKQDLLHPAVFFIPQLSCSGDRVPTVAHLLVLPWQLRNQAWSSAFKAVHPEMPFCASLLCTVGTH